MADRDLVVAAGAVALRRRGDATEVLLVHRPKYDDWSFPKGKLDPGEDERSAAVREVAEETGLTIRLGPPLSSQVYVVGNGDARAKVVHYWVGWCTADDDVTGYRPNDEIDEVRWVPLGRAQVLLDYDRDVALLTEASHHLRPTVPLVVLRHSQAVPRSRWRRNDRRRPLSPAGEQQAGALVPLLAAYGVRLVVSSSSDRCAQTVTPYAVWAGLELELTDALSEEDASEESVAHEMADLVARGTPAVVCGHRPVLPLMLEALGVAPIPLDKGGAVVVHHRRGHIAALERLPAP